MLPRRRDEIGEPDAVPEQHEADRTRRDDLRVGQPEATLCGPNDEPFAFHPSGLNVVMADGSVRFLSESIDGVAVKWLVGARDGQLSPEF